MNYLKNDLHRILGKRIEVFELIHESAPDGFWFWDLNRPESVWVSPAFEKTVGLNGELRNKNGEKWMERIHPDDLSAIKETVGSPSNGPSNGQIFEQSVRYKGASGNELQMMCRGQVIHDDETGGSWLLMAHRNCRQTRNADHSSGDQEAPTPSGDQEAATPSGDQEAPTPSAHDMPDSQDTGRPKELLKQEKENLELLSFINREIPAVLYQFQLYPDGRLSIPYTSSVIYSMFGVPERVLKANPEKIFERIHPDDVDRVNKEIRESAEKLEIFNSEFRIIAPDTDQKWVLTISRPKRQTDGSTLWNGMMMDISARKNSECKLIESNRRLATFLEISREMTFAVEQEDLMQTIIDNAVAVTGLDNGAIYLGNAGETLVLSATNPPLPPDFPEALRIADPEEHPHASLALKSGTHVILADTSKAELTDAEKEIVLQRNLKSVLYVPIRLKENTFGVLILSSTTKTYDFADEEIQLLQGFADQAANAIQNKRNLEHLNAHATYLERSIAERKRIEEELLQSKEKLQHSHDLMSYVIKYNRSSVAVHDKDLHYIYVSQRYLDDYNVKQEEIIGKHHYEVFPDIPQKWRDVHQRALNGEIIGREEDPFQRADGSVQWTSWECRPWYEADGEIGGIIIYGDVITDRKLAELELEKLSAAVEQSPVSVVITDLKGDIEYVNPTFTQVTGYHPEEVTGRNPRVLKSGTQPDAFYRDLWETIRTGNSWTGELHNRKKNGELFWELASISPVFDKKGMITNYLAVKEDITGRKLFEERLIESEKKYRHIFKSLRDFTHIVSHNLRIHTANMLGILMVLEMEEPETYRNHFVQMLKSSSDKLEETVGHLNEVLDIRAKERQDLERVDLHAILEKAVAALAPTAEESEVEIVAKVPPKTIVHAVPSYLDSIMHSLLSNAIKYCSPVRPSWVRIEAERTEGFTVVRVEDNGVGIDMKRHGRKLFKMYKKLHEETQSVGLGLFITRNQVEAMGGRIEAESEVDKGTLFRVYVPEGT